MLILEPERRRISLILVPARPMMHPLRKGRGGQVSFGGETFARRAKKEERNVHHVGGDRDLLLAVVGVGASLLSSVGRPPRLGLSAALPLNKVALLSSARPARKLSSTADPATGVGLLSSTGEAVANHASLRSGVVEDRSLAPVPVLDEALADLGNGETDALGGTRDLDDALGRLGEHLLARDHARARGVLDLTDLGSTLADHGTDEEVRDEKADRGGRGRGRGDFTLGLGGDGVVEDGLGDESVGLSFVREVSLGRRRERKKGTHLGDTVDGSSNAEDSVRDTGDDLGDAGLDVGLGTEGGDGSSTATDDDT